jgi:hypothetical protein
VGVAHPQVEKDEWVLQEEEWALLSKYTKESKKCKGKV